MGKQLHVPFDHFCSQRLLVNPDMRRLQESTTSPRVHWAFTGKSLAGRHEGALEFTGMETTGAAKPAWCRARLPENNRSQDNSKIICEAIRKAFEGEFSSLLYFGDRSNSRPAYSGARFAPRLATTLHALQSPPGDPRPIRSLGGGRDQSWQVFVPRLLGSARLR